MTLETQDNGRSPSGRATHERSQSSLSSPSVSVPNATYRSLYSPARGMIACVLLQAAFGGDRQPCHFFGAGDWETGLPDETFCWITASRDDWRRCGSLPRNERIERFAEIATGASK